LWPDSTEFDKSLPDDGGKKRPSKKKSVEPKTYKIATQKKQLRLFEADKALNPEETASSD
jgi:hypothetical protein